MTCRTVVAFAAAIAALALTSLHPQGRAHAEARAEPKPVQYVVVSFDGCEKEEIWRQTLDLAAEVGKSGATAHFTYFVSGVFLVGADRRLIYQAPRRAPGATALPWAKPDRDELRRRLAIIVEAHRAGHDIGSHAVGHFDGTAWTAAEWRHELVQFKDMLRNAVRINSIPEIELPEAKELEALQVVGFRAPFLATGPGMWKALEELGYVYDASLVASPDTLPERVGGIWRFPLAVIDVAGTGRRAVAMDYNFYLSQTGARETGDPNGALEEQTFRSYMAYFERSYRARRAPVYIGNHFSQWNNGAYWRALRRFVLAACVRPEVRCVSYLQLARALELARNVRD